MADLTYNDLFSLGSIVDLTVGRWDRNVILRMSDLGIERTNEVRQSFTGLGSIKLIPESYVKPCWKALTAATNLWNQYGLYFPLLRGARYTPNTKIRELGAKFAECKLELADEVETLLADYEKAKQEQRPVLVEAFKQACKTTESFEAAISRIPSLYPSPTQIREKFYLRWTIYRLSAPLGDGMQEVARQTSDVKDMLGGMIENLRKEITDRTDEITELVVKSKKISKKTYNSTNRLLDKIDGLTEILADPFIIRASKALRLAIQGAGEETNDGQRDRTLMVGIRAVKEELSESAEEAMKSVVERLTGLGRRKLSLA